MMPKLMAGLMMLFGSRSSCRRRVDRAARRDRLERSLARAAAGADHRLAVALYQRLGFILTMTLLVFTLLVVVERRVRCVPRPTASG